MGKDNRTSLSQRILIGLLLGIVTGLFLGERAAPLNLIGRAYIGLLQMSILPYMVVSLIAGIGGLDYTKAKRLALTAGIVLLGSWLLAFLVIYVMPLAFPDMPAGTFYSPSMVEQRQVDFIDLYIPVNPFRSLARTIVPASAVFSVIFGIALIGIEDKHSLLHLLDTVQKTLTRIAMMVIQLSPFGIFAIAANAAGTLSFADFGRLQVYVTVFILASLLLTFLILPGLTALLTPFSYRAILRACRASLITGFATGNLFIVLPMLIEQAKALFQSHGSLDQDKERFIEVLIPTSFNFPNIGKLITLLFVLFAGWFSGTEIALSQYPAFSLLGLFTLFGGVDLALPFLLDQMRIPADLYQLYLVTGILNGWFATLLAVMNLFTFTLLATAAATGMLRLDLRKLGYFIVGMAVVTGGVVLGVRLFLTELLTHEQQTTTTLLQLRIESPAPARVMKHIPAVKSPPPQQSRLQRILRTRTLRVGYHPGQLPFSFFNDQGELAGYDIALCHRFAQDLKLKLIFVPWTYKTLVTQLHNGQIDLAVGGLLVTPARLPKLLFSTPYMTVTLGVLLPDYRRHDFDTWEAISHAGLRLGISGKTLASAAAEYLPGAHIVKLPSNQTFFQRSDLDGLIISAEAGSAWTTLHPEYAVVIPEPHIATPVAFALPRGDLEWRTFLDTWMTLEKTLGIPRQLYDRWILGKGVKETTKRWSILDTLLDDDGA
ncbi:proton glutamate symport protein [Methylomarinovum tepidoasis]|uniref:Proton glutamate symport protein n=1 Tax=Methylomarinovum tepidoasis TaxID=2840183 RepID=A0AAU9CR85_9GAMM|nr:cation:dicarboxylase symporter family transporter [Methylomarinovum sp. IN45]BCX88893.1 proton glutamate symport protein [Methylomarinovum sp. IN45]